MPLKRLAEDYLPIPDRLPNDRTSDVVAMMAEDDRRRGRQIERMGDDNAETIRESWKEMGLMPARTIGAYREGKRYAAEEQRESDDKRRRDQEFEMGGQQIEAGKLGLDRDRMETTRQRTLNDFEMGADPESGQPRLLGLAEEQYKYNRGSIGRKTKAEELTNQATEESIAASRNQRGLTGLQTTEAQRTAKLARAKDAMKAAMLSGDQAVMQRVVANQRAAGLSDDDILVAQTTAQSEIAGGKRDTAMADLLTRNSDPIYGEMLDRKAKIEGKITAADNLADQVATYSGNKGLLMDAAAAEDAKARFAETLAALGYNQQAQQIMSGWDAANPEQRLSMMKRAVGIVGREIASEVQTAESLSGDYAQRPEFQQLKGTAQRFSQKAMHLGGNASLVGGNGRNAFNPITGMPAAPMNPNAGLFQAGMQPPQQQPPQQQAGAQPVAAPAQQPGGVPNQIPIPGLPSGPTLRHRARSQQVPAAGVKVH